MDEEQNNEQNLMEKANENIQDTTNAVRDGADLAKNVSTGNVVGAVKDSVKLVKNKKVQRIILISILLPILVIVSLGMSLFSIFNTIGDTIQNVVDSFIDLFKIDDTWDGSIKIKDEDIEKVIKGIEDLGFDMDDLWLLGDIEKESTDDEETLKQKQLEAEKKYIRKFLEAQLVTETPHYEPTLSNGNAYGQKTYGKVYLYRTSDAEVVDENTRLYEMSWMPYTKMQEEAAKNNKQGLDAVRMHYSIDEEGKLVIAQWTIIETEVDGKEEPDKIIISLRHIDYKSVISQYTTPVNFFIYLTMVSQNPEFVTAVTEIVKNNTKIDITLLDTVTKTVEENIYGYKRNSRTTHVQEKQNTIRRWTTSGSRDEKTTKITTITSTVPTPKITYAKTWFSEQRITYDLTDQEPYHNFERYDKTNDSSLADDPDPGTPPDEQTYTWNTDKYNTIETDRTGTIYKEGTRGKVIDKTGDKGSQGVTPDSYENNTQNPKYVKKKFRTDSKTTFLGLLDDFFRIPNSDRHEAAGKINIISGADWLFGLMQKDGKLQNLEQVMRYILYKYTGKNYGVTELDLSIFEIRDFTEFTSAGLIVKVDEPGALQPLTQQQIEEIISKRYSGKAYSNLMSSIDAFMSIQNRYHINAIFAIAVTQIESSCGVNWAAIKPATYNWFSIKGSYNGDSMNGWRKYPSFKVAVEDFGELIGTGSAYFAGGNTSIGSIGESYCPPGDEWSRAVSQFVKEMYELVGITVYTSGGNELQAKVAEIAQNSAAYGITAEKNYCQAWVYKVYSAAGASNVSRHCALHAGYEWAVSTDWSQIQVGATVYGYSHSKYGHVGIYIGNGIVAHNVGGVAFDDLNTWINQYNGVCWGWNGVDLTGGAYPIVGGIIARPNHSIYD